MMDDKFWKKVAKGDGCWEWQGYAPRYGRLCRKGRVMLAHRVVWEQTNGPIPAGLEVCHTCDNPKCCNPSHLFLGTHKDNMHDAAVKRRWPRTHPGYTFKLTAEQRRAICAAAADGLTQRAIARMYGVSQPVICRIIAKGR